MFDLPSFFRHRSNSHCGDDNKHNDKKIRSYFRKTSSAQQWTCPIIDKDHPNDQKRHLHPKTSCHSAGASRRNSSISSGSSSQDMYLVHPRERQEEKQPMSGSFKEEYFRLGMFLAVPLVNGKGNSVFLLHFYIPSYYHIM